MDTSHAGPPAPEAGWGAAEGAGTGVAAVDSLLADLWS